MTSQLAAQNTANKINQIIEILGQNGIDENDVKTERISIYPKYNYDNGKSEIVGQTASQSLSVIVRDITADGGNLGALIDALVAVDGISLNGLSFDKEDKSEAQKNARKAAF